MKKSVKPVIGVAALVLAILGLILSIFGSDIAEAIQPSPPIEEKVADLTVRVKDAVIAKLKDRTAVIADPEKNHDWHSTLPKLALAFGVLGLTGAATSYTRGERRSFAISAAGLSLVALTWQAMLISLGAILVIVIIFVVLNQIGIDLSF